MNVDMKSNMYTVEWVEDNGYEVVVVYEDYNEANKVYKELKLKDNVTDIVLSIRDTSKDTSETPEFIKKKVEIR